MPPYTSRTCETLAPSAPVHAESAGRRPTHRNEACISRVCAGRRWFRFAYVAGRADRELLPDHTRDADAALALQPALCARGFRFAGPILNYPAKEQHHPKAPIVFDDSFLQPSDLLVLVTRPPLDDMVDGVRGRIQRSGTTLETKVLACLRRHLAHCSRARVRVADTHARASEEVAQLSNIQFRQKRGAAIDAVLAHASGRWQRGLGAAPTTVAYLIYEQQAWANGCGVLASFGLSGTDTLAWNTILAAKYPELVASAPFLMAEITTHDRVEQPHTLEYLREWKVRLVKP